jgi:predicted lipoprotein with Yx(FWY)xxD motif
VQTTSTQILTDSRGMTLYLYTPDKKNQSTCTGECAQYWPPVLVPSGTQLPAAAPGASSVFGVAPRADGTRQLTYDGAPLYTFIKDKKPGDIAGQGAYGVWWVVAANATQTSNDLPSLVKLAPAQILANAQGMTLYLYTPDKKNRSACTGECAEYWPPVLVPSGASAPAGLPGASGTFGVAPRADGTQELSYDGAPLYTFIKDKKPGDIAGQGAYGVWWVVVASTSGAAAPVRLSPAQILTNTQGMTLYLYTPDKKNRSVCTGQCAQYWPPVLLAPGAQLPVVDGASGVFGVALRADGTRQLTYDGAPLYTFIKDKQPGDRNGQGAYGVWWVVAA